MDHRVLMVFMSLWSSGLLVENENSSTDSHDFRLVGGDRRCAGTLEMKRQDEDWKPVDGEEWNLKLANRVCAELHCGSAVSIRKRKEIAHRAGWRINTDCDESSLNNCFQAGIFSSSVLEMKCSDSVRLVNGSSLCSGRLEVQSNQSWSSVCEGHFDLHDAQVVCRELGCGAPSVLQGALYGEAEASLWKMFQCEGHESALLDCGSSGSDTCSSGRAVGLTCSDPDDVRLVGGASRCDGSLQLKHHGDWKDVDSFVYIWTLKTAAVICHRLDCGSVVSLVRKNHDSFRRVWEISSSCVESTSTLKDCMTTADHASISSLGLTCSDSVRLVHGSSLCSGNLEVQSNQSWSSVCEEDFDLRDAQVVCRELGCGAPLGLQGALYGEGEAPVWTSELQCEGNESALLDCRRSSSAEKTCTSGKTAGLTCADPVRLVGQPSRCAGTLEIKHREEWRMMGVYDEWDLESAASVCRHLDCGSVVSVKTRNDFSLRPVWWVLSSCVNLTSVLWDCISLYPAEVHSSGLEVVCSDLLTQPNISLSVSADGVSEVSEVSEVYQEGFRVLPGSDFNITCSVEPQYPGGSFQLISDTSEPQTRTWPAVNHSAHFLFSAADHTHRGDYTCVYHVDVFSQNFSSQSRTLHLSVGDLPVA